MSDTYQAVYDAVRSRIGSIDIGAAVSQAFDISHAVEMVKQEFFFVLSQHQRPSILMRPTLSIDGDQWCALYGDDLQKGVAGFGKSPDEAMENFDEVWVRKLEIKK